MTGPVGIGVDVGVVEVDDTGVVEVDDMGVVEVDDMGVVEVDDTEDVTESVVFFAEKVALVEAETVVRVVVVVDVDVAVREYN